MMEELRLAAMMRIVACCPALPGEREREGKGESECESSRG